MEIRSLGTRFFPLARIVIWLLRSVPARALAADSHLSRGPVATRCASLAVSIRTVAVAGYRRVALKIQAVRASLSKHAFRSGAASLA